MASWAGHGTSRPTGKPWSRQRLPPNVPCACNRGESRHNVARETSTVHSPPPQPAVPESTRRIATSVTVLGRPILSRTPLEGKGQCWYVALGEATQLLH